MKKIILFYSLLFALVASVDGKAAPVGANPPTPVTTATPPAPLTISTADAAPDAATLSLGERVYKSTCSICHQSGLRGAPKIGSARDWEARLAQEKETLYKRALGGYRGKKGSMPSRGSNAKLSENEVKAAVDYMVVHAIPAWSIGK